MLGIHKRDMENRFALVEQKIESTRTQLEQKIDTLQLGLAPYEHDYDDVATWFVIQGRRYTGEVFDGTEWALLLRLFKGNKWVDVGATTDGKLQAMFMFNFY